MEHTNRGLKTGSTENTVAQRSSEDKGGKETVVRSALNERRKQLVRSRKSCCIFDMGDTIAALSKENNSCSSRSQDVIVDEKIKKWSG